MRAEARFLGHSVHQMLVVFPLGLLATVIWAFAGAGIALVTALLGGELVDRLAVGVDEDAGVSAPGSLRSRHVATGK